MADTRPGSVGDMLDTTNRRRVFGHYVPVFVCKVRADAQIRSFIHAFLVESCAEELPEIR